MRLMARESKPFRDRNPVIIGAVSLGVIAALVLLAFNAQSLPLIGGGTVYPAPFAQAARPQPHHPGRGARGQGGKVESPAPQHRGGTAGGRGEEALSRDP